VAEFRLDLGDAYSINITKDLNRTTTHDILQQTNIDGLWWKSALELAGGNSRTLIAASKRQNRPKMLVLGGLWLSC
jgi:ABC-type lipopolysaccharide export system ATPase subunit